MTNPANESAPLQIVFNHRLDFMNYDLGHASFVSDATAPMMLRAKNIIKLISDIHQEAHINQIDPEQIYWVINSVVRELEDIEAIIDLDYQHRLQSQGGEA